MSRAPVASSDAARLLADASAFLAARGIDSPRLDAEVLLSHCLGVTRNALIVEVAAGRDRSVAPEVAGRFLELIARRERREPVAYLTGHKEFWSLDLEVTPDVLIPRPETEHVVERALALLPSPGRDARASRGESEAGRGAGHGLVRVVDVGTGSGAIAIAIAHERPDATVLALDRSPAALMVARRNTIRHRVDGRVHFLIADLLESVRGPVHAVVSNPPYILRSETDDLMPDVRDWEPEAALFDDEPGAGILVRLVAGAARVLAPGGSLVVEIAAARSEEALALLEASHLWDDAGVAPDLAGLKRVLQARRRWKP